VQKLRVGVCIPCRLSDTAQVRSIRSEGALKSNISTLKMTLTLVLLTAGCVPAGNYGYAPSTGLVPLQLPVSQFRVDTTAQAIQYQTMQQQNQYNSSVIANTYTRPSTTNYNSFPRSPMVNSAIQQLSSPQLGCSGLYANC
jgi:hypothetical protein